MQCYQSSDFRVSNQVLISSGGYGKIFEADFADDLLTGESKRVILKYIKYEAYRDQESAILRNLEKSKQSAFTAELLGEWKEICLGEIHYVLCLEKLGFSLLQLRDPKQMLIT